MRPQIGHSYNEERLYNETSEHSSFNVEVMRGMDITFDADGNPETLYAIHSYQSSVVRYDLAGLPASPGEVISASNDNRWKTITDPVAIAVTDSYVFVLGQGSHALAKHDRQSGDIVDVMMLRSGFSGNGFVPPLQWQRLGSEPADMVVNEAGTTAYISLMGADAVVEISLATMTEEHRWQPRVQAPGTSVNWKRPRFLALDETNDALYVAPFLSGNGTFTVPDSDLGVQDGHDEATGLATTDIHSKADVITGLPDEDLFRIDLTDHSIAAVVTEAGTLLTGHGVGANGTTYWMLGIESLNTGANSSSEPELQGSFVRNILSVNTGTFLGGPPASGTIENGLELDLDDLSQTSTYSSDQSIPFPYAMAMGGPKGITAIASSTLSRVALYPPDAMTRSLINLGSATSPSHGKVIRSVKFTRNGDLYIYCQQTSNIIVWHVDSNGDAAADASHSFFLGDDPSSDNIEKGREIFYDATRSLNSRFTCASCHPGGESDVLNWELNDGLTDFKDPMLTQTLKGLRETFPYHWRGERNLEAFNDAFHGLLGEVSTQADEAGLNEEELGFFQDFIFSLRPAANPHALLERTMRRVFAPLGSNPLTDQGNTASGLTMYEGHGEVGCADCHPFPTGGMGLAFRDSRSSNLLNVATNSNLEMVQLSNFLQAREQPLVEIETNIGVIERSLLGSGFRHNSGEHSVFGFIDSQFSNLFGDAGVPHVAAFIQAMDTSTPPAAHAAVHWSGSASQEEMDINQALIDDLIRQAGMDWIDLVAFGTGPVDNNGTALMEISWKFEPDGSGSGSWVPDGFQNSSPLDAGAITSAGASEITFLGTLHGQGDRLGLDYDNDLIRNRNEIDISLTDEWDSDGDDDGLPDGYEIRFEPNGQSDMSPPAFVSGPTIVNETVNGSTAIVKFSTTEPVTWELTATPSLTSPFEVLTSKGTSFGRVHTAHIHGLTPSFMVNDASAMDLTWDVELTVFDLSGNYLGPIPVLQIGDGAALGPLRAADLVGLAVPNGIVVEEFVWSADNQPQGNGGPFVGTADIKLRRYADTSNVGGVENFVVLAQVQRRASGLDQPWIAVPNENLRHSAPNFRIDALGLPDTINPTVEIPDFANPPLLTVDYAELIGNPLPTPLMALAATDMSGDAQVTIVVPNVVTGETVRVQIVAIFPVPTGQAPSFDPKAPHFPNIAQAGAAMAIPPVAEQRNQWNMPLTLVGLRSLTFDI